MPSNKPSITSFTRLEPRTRNKDMSSALHARVFDPCWMLARQWQLGEFNCKDGGSPVKVHLQAECTRLSRYQPGPLDNNNTGKDYDSSKLPLETLVERERVHTEEYPNLRVVVEAGLHFLRLLDAQYIDKTRAENYRAGYLDLYALKLTDAEHQKLDNNSFSFLKIMTNRVLDGSLLYKDLKQSLYPPGGVPGSLPENPPIDQADYAKVKAAAESWLKFYETLFSEPAPGDKLPWNPQRMEYQFAVSARIPDSEAPANQEVVLTAKEYAEGNLEWHSFTVNPNASLGATGKPELLERTVIPSPVRYKGMPASRFWEFEDAQIDFGSVKAGPEDLSRLLFIEFALIFGDDWFVMPMEMPVGSLCRIRSLVVTDTFGKKMLILPYTAIDPADSPWRMFCLSPDRKTDINNELWDIFFLPPVIGASLESPPVEEVLFLRDEMANMAWAVEGVVESASGKPLNRFEAFQEERRRQEKETALQGEAAMRLAPIAYRLATSVPEYWIPLIPQKSGSDLYSIWLVRGKMFDKPSGEPWGRILEPGHDLKLYEEEVTRAGSCITRSYQYTRWIDGSQFLWIGRQERPGRGEGSSGLRFDIVETN